jgi:hypothetical protein
MSDEFDPIPESNYSPFWPLLILLIGFFGWFAVQDYELNVARIAYDKQFQAAVPTLNDAQTIGNRYVALMEDLVQTARDQKDPVAQQIVREAIQSGLIHVSPPTGTNSTANPAEPAPAPAK